MIGVCAARQDNNIFTQIGFVVLIGLAAKNAILIVEFAKQARGARARHASRRSCEACRLRLRPILMTAFAFILGVVPLVIATGAGAEMRQALGTAVFFGMIGRDAVRPVPHARLLRGHSQQRGLAETQAGQRATNTRPGRIARDVFR